MTFSFSKCPDCGRLNIHGARCVCGTNANRPARLDAYARTMRTGMVALAFVAGMANLIPRTPGEFPAETVSGEVRR